jgi:glycosyltransferase involved in cell wall biosynthesis
MTDIPDQKDNIQSFDLSIIIPVYNEEQNVTTLLETVLASIDSKIRYELIMIEDGSNDNTKTKLEEFHLLHPETRLIINDRNLGKSASVIKGINAANSDYIVIQDADLEYNPMDINTLYHDISEKNYDVALGNRFAQYNPKIHWYGFYGNIILTTIFNVFSIGRINIVVGDMHVCYKMMRTSIAKEIVNSIGDIKDSFALDTIILVRLTQFKKNSQNLKFINIPVFYYPRQINEGKKLNPITDGLKCLFYIFKYNIF